MGPHQWSEFGSALINGAYIFCRHLHLHVLSADLCSERMKNKKHYNSFHPKLGFFLDINEVVSWFEAEPSYYSTVRIALAVYDTITSPVDGEIRSQTI